MKPVVVYHKKRRLTSHGGNGMSESAAQKAKKAPPERGIAKPILMLRLQSDVLRATFFV